MEIFDWMNDHGIRGSVDKFSSVNGGGTPKEARGGVLGWVLVFSHGISQVAPAHLGQAENRKSLEVGHLPNQVFGTRNVILAALCSWLIYELPADLSPHESLGKDALELGYPTQESGSVMEQVPGDGCGYLHPEKLPKPFWMGAGSAWSHCEVGHALRSGVEQKSHPTWIFCGFRCWRGVPREKAEGERHDLLISVSYRGCRAEFQRV